MRQKKSLTDSGLEWPAVAEALDKSYKTSYELGTALEKLKIAEKEKPDGEAPKAVWDEAKKFKAQFLKAAAQKGATIKDDLNTDTANTTKPDKQLAKLAIITHLQPELEEAGLQWEDVKAAAAEKTADLRNLTLESLKDSGKLPPRVKKTLAIIRLRPKLLEAAAKAAAKGGWPNVELALKTRSLTQLEELEAKVAKEPDMIGGLLDSLFEPGANDDYKNLLKEHYEDEKHRLQQWYGDEEDEETHPAEPDSGIDNAGGDMRTTKS